MLLTKHFIYYVLFSPSTLSIRLLSIVRYLSYVRMYKCLDAYLDIGTLC